MDLIIYFFRDILAGPLYIVLVIVNSILICSCIGYLGEKYLKKKKAKEKFNSLYVNVSTVPAGKTNNAVGTSNMSSNNSQNISSTVLTANSQNK